MGNPHLNAAKGQVVQLGGFDPGAEQVRQPRLRGLGQGVQTSRRPRKSGQFRDLGRGKHRASRRAGTL
jgi:hypothetical protein